MSNQWGRPSRVRNRKSIVKRVSIILIIGTIVYLFFPVFKNRIVPLIMPAYAATNSSNYNQPIPNTNNFSAQNSSTNSRQDSPSPYNLASDNLKNEVTTGYWLLFVANGQMNQLSVDAETTTFIQQLIERDRKTTGKNTLVLVENGRFRQYMVSDEINSVVSNLSAIDTRVSKGSGNSGLNGSGNSSLNGSTNFILNNSGNSSLNAPVNPTNPQNLNPNNSTNSNSSSPSINQPNNSSSNTNTNPSTNESTDTSNTSGSMGAR